MLVRRVDATQANLTFTPTATSVVFVRYGCNRFPNKTYQLASNGIDMTKWGFPKSYTSQLPYDAFPAITMSGDVSSFGSGGCFQSTPYSHRLFARLSKILGRHNPKRGVDSSH